MRSPYGARTSRPPIASWSVTFYNQATRALYLEDFALAATRFALMGGRDVRAPYLAAMCFALLDRAVR